MNRVWSTYESPIGPLTLIAGNAGLAALHFPGRGGPFDARARDDDALSTARGQLEEYFAGVRTQFELELDLSVGTPFQRSVWERLRVIPHGVTLSYGELAGALGRPDRTRAVGAAIGRTPVPIIVPCHRVIGANGDLTGYLGGLQRKRALLDLEAAVSRREPLSAVWAGRQLSLI
jgi:methylated-DNA-[protein]-cysteine S-methyltransferase